MVDCTIAESARLGKNCVIGKHSIIMDNVEIGDNCRIGNFVVIYQGTQIGSGVRIDDHAVIGKHPMRSPRSIFKDQQEYDPTRIGNNCQIGTGAIIYVQVELGHHNLIADLATIRENVKIGGYNIIGRAVAIENYVEIGNRNKLETNSYITAYSKIEDYCFVAPAVATSNDNFMGRDKERFKHFKGVTIKTGGRIGVNATVLPGLVIEPDGMVAGGSVVTNDISSQDIWVGNPARKKKKVPDSQLLKNNLDKK